LLTMVENEIHKETPQLEKFSEKVCNAIPKHYSEYKLVCDFLVKEGIDIVVALMMKDYTASDICIMMKVAECKGCTLNNHTRSAEDEKIEGIRNGFVQRGQLASMMGAIRTIPRSEMFASVQQMIHDKYEHKALTLKNGKTGQTLLNEKKLQTRFALQTWMVALVSSVRKFGQNVLPQENDDDGDYFPGSHLLLRGADWRGLDCMDKDANIKPTIIDTNVNNKDMNCNGIYGTEPTSGKSYESLFCNTTTR